MLSAKFHHISLDNILVLLMAHFSLRLKLVGMVAGALALAIIVATLMLRHMLYQNLLQEKKTIADVITTSIAQDIKYEYQRDRENPLAEGIIIKYITYYRMIKRISLYDIQSRNIADSESGYVSTITQDPNIILALSKAKPIIKIDRENLMITSISPILQGSKIFAAVVIDISIRDITDSLSAINYRIGFIFIVTIFISSVTIIIMLYETILPRLERLINVTKEIASGNYNIQIEDKQGDEIGQLVQAFKQMATDLDESKHALETYHARNLEQKIQELDKAYQELKNAQSQLVHNEKMASLGILVSGIAHEINTPLGAISNVSRSIVKRINILPKLFDSFNFLGVNPLDQLAVECLRELISTSMWTCNSLMLKEIQAVENYLRQAGVNNWREVAHALVNLNFYKIEKLEKYLNCFRNPILFRLMEVIGTVAQAAKISQASCDKIQEVVRALRYYAYLDKDKIELIQVNDSIQTVLVLLRNKLKYKVDVLTDLDPNIPLIRFTSEIHQIWINLLNNAYDAIEEMGEDYSGKIVVSSRIIDEYVAVTVSDNGVGIPEDKSENIFDPFFTTKDIGKGTGLGLSIVSGIVKRYNGTIRVQQLREPTIFEVILPLSGVTIRQDQQESLKPSVTSMIFNAGKSIKLL